MPVRFRGFFAGNGGIFVSKSEFLLDKQVDCVLAALMPANRTAVRVALETGLRIGDVLSIKTDSIAPVMRVLEHKTGKTRVVRLPDRLLADLRAGAGEVWAFPGRDPAKHRSRQAVWYDVKRAAKAFRLPQNVCPHSMRKVYAVRLWQRYGDIERVRCVLNHKSLSTTLIYAMADQLLENSR